ncbi:cysteine desulfurase/selenocysteine lyase [Catalinimonas alkaloidigena]|uniref:aminotransferase class V-fold PLP-dependent enzyme n=1 Tax=Catalinimonas alkaloidigena TaxID=1075417 RepID=UPI0024052492|nr:aminotransferase class V-fold PLP-dependent enzyme [Catalinimonas alkaloidigena]MDF9797114.1 cysteine desulfurase/selenocysteine lyase [Catalinimonas alkaloidigena]
MQFNIEQIRKDTPACQNKLFLNSAGSSLMPAKVVAGIQQYLEEEAKLGGYKVADLQEHAINTFYQDVAKLINAESNQIAFAFSATEAYAKALSSLSFEAGDVILTSDDDYVSNQIHFISLQQRFKISIVRAKNLNSGDIDLEDLEKQIQKHHPKLVAITHVPTNSGLVQDAAGIGKICEKYDVLYLLDACQSVGQMVVDVQQIKCDFMSVTGRKYLRGPRGTGFLYVSDKLLKKGYAPLYIDLRGANWDSDNHYSMLENARRFESWELPYALLLGLKEAVAYANLIGLKDIEIYNQKISRHLRKRLSALSGVRLFDQGTRKCNIISLQKEGKSLEQIQAKLDAENVIYSTANRSSALLDFDKKGIDWVVRLSPHYFNTLEEIDQVVDIIDHI